VHHSNAAVVCTREDRREVLVVSRPGGREDGRLELQNLVDPFFRRVQQEIDADRLRRDLARPRSDLPEPSSGTNDAPITPRPPASETCPTSSPPVCPPPIPAQTTGCSTPTSSVKGVRIDSNAALPGNRQSDEASKQRDRAP
jgi:hypothetical protein